MLKKLVEDKRISFLYVFVIFALITGFTYALGTASLAFNISTALISVDESAYGSTTFDSSNINFIPILDSDVETSTDNVVKIDFTVGGASTNNNSNIIYDIALVDLAVDCNLLSPYIKWKLVKDGTDLSSGSLSYTFDTIEDGRLVLTEIQQDLPNYNADKTGYHNYTFYMWLSDSCQETDIASCKGKEDQSALMGKYFSGKVEVELYTESKKALVRNPGTTLDETTCGGGYIVSYNLNGGTTSENSVVVVPGETYGTLPVPTRSSIVTFNVNGGDNVASEVANFTFEGWYSDEALTEEVTSDTIVPTADSYTLYAKWSGGTITLPTPTKTGSAFEGWYKEGTFVNKVNNDEVYEKNTTLYARWETTVFTISYNANGGTGTMSSQTASINSPITISSNTFTKTGYKFTGWNTSADGSGTDYTDWIGVSNTWTLESDLTLYAQWELGTYTISYNANGGTGTMSNQTATYLRTITISSNTFTKTGYKFVGWNTSSDGSGTDFTSWIDTPTTWPFETDITLYAQWETTSVYIKYNVNGGTVAEATSNSSYSYTWSTDSDGIISMSVDGGTARSNITTIAYGASNELYDYNNSGGLYITKTGYIGVGGAEWVCIGGDCTLGDTFDQATSYAHSAYCDASNDDCTAILGVNWTAKTVNLTFSGNSPTNYVTATNLNTYTFNNFTGGSNQTYGIFRIYLDDTITTSTVFRMTGTITYSDITVADGQTSAFWVQGSGDQTNWSPGFRSTGYMSGFSGSGTKNFSETFSLNESQLTNNYFIMGVRADYVNGGTIKLSNVKLTRVENTTVSKTYGQLLGTLPSSPTDRSRTFNGWYTATSGGTKITTSTAVPASDTTYYGQWTPISRTITIKPNSGSYNGSTSNTTKTTTDSSYTMLTTPTRTNYEFNGYTITGNGAYIGATSPSVTSSEYTKTVVSDSAGGYINFKYSGDNEFTSSKWLSVAWPNYTVTSVKSAYEIQFKVRINTMSGAGLNFRHASASNDWATDSVNAASATRTSSNAKIGEWETITLTRTFNSSTTTIGTSSYDLNPRFEIYTGDIANKTVNLDFDIKDVVIRRLNSDALIQASNPTYYTRYGNSTLTANWTLSRVRKTAAISGNRYCYREGGWSIPTDTSYRYYPTSGTYTDYTSGSTEYDTIQSTMMIGTCSGSAYIYTDTSSNPLDIYTASNYGYEWVKVYIASANVSGSNWYYDVTDITDTITVDSTTYYAVWFRYNYSTDTFTSIT